jgi:hypothetical protein
MSENNALIAQPLNEDEQHMLAGMVSPEADKHSKRSVQYRGVSFVYQNRWRTC